MKKILYLLFLIGCGSSHPQPLSIPKEANITCTGDICCYPIDTKTLACVSSNPALNSVVFYVKIVER